MMTLSVNTISTEDHGATVSWYVGQENNGILEIDMGAIDRDHAIAGELCAIRYLVFRKKVFNIEPKSGQGLKLRVSYGAIRKLINGTSSKKHLKAYALFAKPRLSEAVFAISKEPLPVTGPLERLRLDEIYDTWHEPINVPALGRVHVTNHALDRFIERVQQPVLKDPLDSLLHRMLHKQFRQMKLPNRVLAHKARKYGQAQTTEIWGHPESRLRFLITRDHPEQATLLTVFRTENGG